MATVKLIVVRIKRIYRSKRTDERVFVRDEWERHTLEVPQHHLSKYGRRGAISRYFAKWEGR